MLLALGWSAAWLVIRDQTRSGLDDWIASQAADGRRWSCGDRAFGGFPFRIEIRCSDFTLDQTDVHASIGPLLVVSQIYRPRHVIAEAAGPLKIRAGATQAYGAWRLLQASVIVADGGFERISVSVENPTTRVDDPVVGQVELSSRHFEAHLRPDPTKPAAFDLAITSLAAKNPLLDTFLGGVEPADIRVGLDITEARDLGGRPLATELERWRLAGGRVELTALSIAKGPRRLEATGGFGLDERHRVQGQLDARAAQIGGLLGQLAAAGNGVGGLLGALLGATAQPPPGPKAGGPPAALTSLPPLRLDGGRLVVGSIQIPGFRLPPLY